MGDWLTVREGTWQKNQKVALEIILADDYDTYDLACEQNSLKSLSLRKSEVCTNFAVKLYRSDRSSDFSLIQTRDIVQEPQLVVEQNCITKRCYNAPHNYLARLLNQNHDKIIHSL